MALLDQLLQHLSGAPTNQIGQQLGLDSQATSSAIANALPVILGGLANNTQSEGGASALSMALDRDHDGSILDDLAGFAASGASANGEGILGHIFGSKKEQAGAAVEKSGGISATQAAQLMAILAPIVMAYLGKKKREAQLDASGVAKELQVESDKHGPPDTSLAGMVGKMLDSNNDGSAFDDVMRIGGSLLSRWNK